MSDSYPIYGGKRASLAQIQQMDGFKRLHPTLQDRVSRLMVASGGKVGFGEGFRSEEQQRQMFLSRYTQDVAGPVLWNGQRWKHVSGATAAAPGQSMHELGLAADLVGEMAWITANCTQCKLKNFSSVNDEPWHVQASELPNSRHEYEKLGSPWSGGAVAPAQTSTPTKQARASAPDPAARPDAIPDTVTPGMRGPAAGQLQDVMIRLGLISDTPGNRDQFYGPASQKIIKQFPTDHGLVPDAEVGPKTWAALLQLD